MICIKWGKYSWSSISEITFEDLLSLKEFYLLKIVWRLLTYRGSFYTHLCRQNKILRSTEDVFKIFYIQKKKKQKHFLTQGNIQICRFLVHRRSFKASQSTKSFYFSFEYFQKISCPLKTVEQMELSDPRKHLVLTPMKVRGRFLQFFHKWGKYQWWSIFVKHFSTIFFFSKVFYVLKTEY